MVISFSNILHLSSFYSLDIVSSIMMLKRTGRKKSTCRLPFLLVAISFVVRLFLLEFGLGSSCYILDISYLLFFGSCQKTSPKHSIQAIHPRPESLLSFRKTLYCFCDNFRYQFFVSVKQTYTFLYFSGSFLLLFLKSTIMVLFRHLSRTKNCSRTFLFNLVNFFLILGPPFLSNLWGISSWPGHSLFITSEVLILFLVHQSLRCVQK